MGKWDKFKGKLERYQETDIKRIDKIEQRKDDIRQRLLLNDGKVTGANLCNLLVECRGTKEEIEEELKDLSLDIDALTQLIDEQFENDDVSAVVLANGYRVAVHSEPYPSVKDREAYRQWLIKHEYESQLTLPWQTTKAMCKDLLESGEPFPDGVEVFLTPKLYVTKS